MIGIIVLSRSPPSIEIFGMECLLVGYFFHPSSWGNGYATEALQAGIESVKDRIQGCKVVGWISPGNVASERVAKKCGFNLDRYHKRDDSNIFVGGEWRENAYNIFVKDV
jgi:RimJ/RimL family protein N-acetyltransferase